MNNDPSTSESGGSRGVEVLLSPEDYVDLHKLCLTDPSELRVPDKSDINFDVFEVLNIAEFSTFRDFILPHAFVRFSLINGQFSALQIKLVDAAAVGRPITISVDIGEAIPFTVEDEQQRQIVADPTIIKRMLLHILLDNKDTHEEDYTFLGLLEQSKLFHPERDETHTYTKTNGFFDPTLMTPENINFSLHVNSTNVAIKTSYGNRFYPNDEPYKSELTIVTDSSQPVMDNYYSNEGNLHVATSRREFKGLAEGNVITIITSRSSVMVHEETSRSYGSNEAVLLRNLENTLAAGGAVADDYLKALCATIDMFKKSD